jgi:alkanesulfonate monooxygenase SsuD/methylene tetrahydromethanopterin reductase-like flavin-dependent oxidoreductase (luciferase family)
MRHGLYVAPFRELADVRALAEVSAEAEASGWDGIFVWDHVMTHDNIDVADPWIALTAIALATERVRLGAMVTPLARRRPWDVARQVAVLDRLSGGRMVFGAGLGGDSRRELTAFGEERDPRARAALLDEALDVVTDLWTGRPVTRDGPTRRRCARRRCSSRAHRCGSAACGPTVARSCARRASTARSPSATRDRSVATTCGSSSRRSMCIAPPGPGRSTSWSSTTTVPTPRAWPS